MMPRYRSPRVATASFLRAPQGAPREIREGLDDLRARWMRLRAVAAEGARQAEAEARRTAPWKDRTGQARARLRVYVHARDIASFAITFAHGVYYGKYLEYRWGGRFAILRPIADTWVPRIRDRMRNVFRRMPGQFSLRRTIDTSSAFDHGGRRWEP
jgi:hypothetical protein